MYWFGNIFYDAEPILIRLTEVRCLNIFEWSRFWDAFPLILQNLNVTLEMIVISELLGIVLGLVIAVIRIHKSPVLNQIFSVFISFVRGTPVMGQLLIVLYGLPGVVDALFGIDINGWEKFVFASITLSLNEAGLLAEIFRSAISSIPATQYEAGYSVGLTWWQTFSRIILPQAVKVAIPSYGVNLVQLIQSTSLAYYIGVIDIMGRAKAIATTTMHNLEPYLVCTVIYVVFSLLVKLVFQQLSKKTTYQLKA